MKIESMIKCCINKTSDLLMLCILFNYTPKVNNKITNEIKYNILITINLPLLKINVIYNMYYLKN